MALRPTRHESGKYCAPVHIDFNVNGQRAVSILAAFGEEFCKSGSAISKSHVERVIREAMTAQGNDAGLNWTEGVWASENIPELWRWAHGQIARHWPDWASGVQADAYDRHGFDNDITADAAQLVSDNGLTLATPAHHIKGEQAVKILAQQGLGCALVGKVLTAEEVVEQFRKGLHENGAQAGTEWFMERVPAIHPYSELGTWRWAHGEIARHWPDLVATVSADEFDRTMLCAAEQYEYEHRHVE